MPPTADTVADEFVRFYGPDAWTDWLRLQAHFDLGDGFAFLILLLPGAVGAEICRRQLKQHLETKGKHLAELPCEWPEDARRLPERLLAIQAATNLGGIWLGTVIPESDPEIKNWQQAWRQGLASLNQQRNPLRERFACPVVLVGAPWLQTLLRETAPDLWSVRTGVVLVSPSLEPTRLADTESGLFEANKLESANGETTADPDYVLEQAERLRNLSGLEIARAKLLLRAGNGFRERGRLLPAENCYRESAELFYKSSTHNSENEAELAGALNNLAITLSDLGRQEEGLAKTLEGLQIREHLAKERPGAFLPDLAGSLNTQAVILSALGRREESLDKAEDAFRIRERLANVMPDVFLPDLAITLSNLANTLSASGRLDEALTKAQESLRIYEQLAQAKPGAFLPELAGSLSNMANRLSALGRREEALVKAQEALRIREQLALANPDAFMPDLAASLNNLAAMLSDLDRREESLVKAREAVRIYEQLSQSRNKAFLPDLAMSLNTLSNRLSDSAQPEEALEKAQESLQIYKQLAQASPEAFRPNVAGALNNLANRLCEVARLDEALAKIQESLRIREQLAQTRPEASLPSLAMSYGSQGAILTGLGRHGEAASSFAKGIKALMPLFQKAPRAFADLINKLCQNYIQAMQQAKLEPDPALLAPVEAVFEKLKANPSPI